MTNTDAHKAIKVTRVLTMSYTLRPGVYTGCSTEEAIKRETDNYDLTDFAITLRYRKPEEVDMQVSFEVIDS
jgi:hypothetical protein